MLAGLVGLYPIVRMRETARMPMEQVGKPAGAQELAGAK